MCRPHPRSTLSRHPVPSHPRHAATFSPSSSNFRESLRAEPHPLYRRTGIWLPSDSARLCHESASSYPAIPLPSPEIPPTFRIPEVCDRFPLISGSHSSASPAAAPVPWYRLQQSAESLPHRSSTVPFESSRCGHPGIAAREFRLSPFGKCPPGFPPAPEQRIRWHSSPVDRQSDSSAHPSGHSPNRDGHPVG